MDDEPFEDDIEEDLDESEVEDSLDDEPEFDDPVQDDSKDDIGWEEIAMFGALSEEIADEEKERRKLEREMVADRKNRKRKDNENLK